VGFEKIFFPNFNNIDTDIHVEFVQVIAKRFRILGCDKIEREAFRTTDISLIFEMNSMLLFTPWVTRSSAIIDHTTTLFCFWFFYWDTRFSSRLNSNSIFMPWTYSFRYSIISSNKTRGVSRRGFCWGILFTSYNLLRWRKVKEWKN
jgi:hypothetical protein